MLSIPRPNFAFGLSYHHRSDVWKKILKWQDFSIPSISLIARQELSLPFLVIECKSDHGTLRQAEHQLANALVMSHDMLCSLNLQDSLYVFGIVQVELFVRFYISYSKRQLDEDGLAYCDEVCVPTRIT